MPPQPCGFVDEVYVMSTSPRIRDVVFICKSMLFVVEKEGAGLAFPQCSASSGAEVVFPS